MRKNPSFFLGCILRWEEAYWKMSARRKEAEEELNWRCGKTPIFLVRTITWPKYFMGSEKYQEALPLLRISVTEEIQTSCWLIFRWASVMLLKEIYHRHFSPLLKAAELDPGYNGPSISSLRFTNA